MLRDDRLSYRARGILAVILSRPDNWSASAEELTRTGQEGRDAIRTALSELETAGYLRREKRQDQKGRWSTQAVVYDDPHSAEQLPFDPPATGFQASVNQPSVFQALKTNTVKNNLPSEGDETPKPAADQIAKAVYEAAQGMINYMAIRAIAAKALKVEGATQETVQAVMIQLHQDGKPIVAQSVGQALARKTTTTTNAAHWANGGEF